MVTISEGGTTVPRWITFTGTVKRYPGFTQLHPDEDDDIEITCEDDDVREEGAEIVVRKEAKARKIFVPPDSVVATKQPRKSRSQPSCKSGETCCLGGVEFCCDDGKIMGSCVGSWPCP